MATQRRQLELTKVRLDKWLWAARFFKTRKLATEAITGGRVHLNGARVKPAKAVICGDMLEVTRGMEHFEVEVLGLNDQRRPAKEAVLLYAETEESIEKRAQEVEAIKMTGAHVNYGKKPGKHERKQLRNIKKYGS
ncbi:MAG: RNA-binding protein [Thiotrichaceae bacterium]|nr:RNA-binding protein [Thiotrichaceae bacterium]